MKLLSVFAMLLFFLPVTGHAAAKKLRIYVSIAPQKFLLERLAGDTVTVKVMLQPGSSPEFYEPLPKQLAELSASDLYFQIGVPFEKHWQHLLDNSRTVTVIHCCNGIFDDLKSGHARDPHVWTSPVKVMKLAGIMKNSLQEHNAAGTAFYEENYNQLLVDLERLHESIRRKVDGLARKSFVVVHPSWGHFAGEYGLRQLSLEQGNGRITPRTMANLVALAKSEGINTIFAQQRFHRDRVAAFAGEIGARIEYLDPLAGDYLANMSRVSDSILQSMR